MLSVPAETMGSPSLELGVSTMTPSDMFPELLAGEARWSEDRLVLFLLAIVEMGIFQKVTVENDVEHTNLY